MTTTMISRSTPAPSAPGHDHSSWRVSIARRIAADIDPERFGVRAAYLFGSAKDGSAGPDSDIDLLIHVEPRHEGRRELEVWLEGWSRCLGEINYLCTGARSTGLLDVHFLTDEDFELKTTYARKIGAVDDGVEPLRLGSSTGTRERNQPIRARDRLGLFDG